MVRRKGISPLKKKLIIAVAVLAVVVGSWVAISHPPKRGGVQGGDVVIQGQSICLPHRDTSGPTTLECAFGIKADDGNNYALDLSATGQMDIQTGKRFRISGTLVPIEAISSDTWQKYDVQGIIQVLSFQEILAVPGNWKTYSNPTLGFMLKYDPQMTFQLGAQGSAQWYFWGPTQRGQTELYDGMNLTISRQRLTGNFHDIIAARIEEFKQVGTITVPLHDVMMNGVPAKSFSASSLGEFTLLFIPVDEASYLEVSYMAPDPTHQGFQKVIDTMLSTLTLVMP